MMNSRKPHPTRPVNLEQLFRRGDVWRGQSQRFVSHASLDTGHVELNACLLNKGWPLASLVEVCQPIALNGHTNAVSQGEWLLIAPALHQLKKGYIVLLNPPAVPFAPGLIQAGVDLNRLIVIETEKKADFLASFIELVRSDVCTALLAWQPKQNLNYTELRKCQLACSDGKGLYLLFRPISVQQHNSPAALRLRTKLHFHTLEVRIFKQKGSLERDTQQSIHLPLPVFWLPSAPHADLDRSRQDLPNDKAAALSDFKRNQS